MEIASDSAFCVAQCIGFVEVVCSRRRRRRWWWRRRRMVGRRDGTTKKENGNWWTALWFRRTNERTYAETKEWKWIRLLQKETKVSLVEKKTAAKEFLFSPALPLHLLWLRLVPFALCNVWSLACSNAIYYKWCECVYEIRPNKLYQHKCIMRTGTSKRRVQQQFSTNKFNLMEMKRCRFSVFVFYFRGKTNK